MILSFRSRKRFDGFRRRAQHPPMPKSIKERTINVTRGLKFNLETSWKHSFCFAYYFIVCMYTEQAVFGRRNTDPWPIKWLWMTFISDVYSVFDWLIIDRILSLLFGTTKQRCEMCFYKRLESPNRIHTYEYIIRIYRGNTVFRLQSPL